MELILVGGNAPANPISRPPPTPLYPPPSFGPPHLSTRRLTDCEAQPDGMPEEYRREKFPLLTKVGNAPKCALDRT